MREVQLEQVKPKLYVGPIEVAFKVADLKEAGITHIVDLSNEKYTHRPDLFKYLSIQVTDDPTTDIIEAFHKVKEFMHAGVESSEGGGVLVHCKAGISRSVAVVIAYLIWKDGMNYEEAFKLVKAARQQASPNVGFQRQLKSFEEQRD